jgi:outer membrane protein assembly factor BamA
MSKKNFSKFIKLSFFIAIAFLFPLNISAQEKNKIIQSVDIQGNRRLTDEEIYTHIKTRALQKFDKKQLQKDLETLINLGWFDSTQIKTLTEIGIKGGVVVIFQVRELPIIDEVNFEGLENSQKKKLLQL